MSSWRLIPIPSFCERLIGFSIPIDDTVLAVSYEGHHLIRLRPQVSIETDEEFNEYDLFDHNTGRCQYQGQEWNIIGLYPGQPITNGWPGETLLLDKESNTIAVRREGVFVWKEEFENFSGDWSAATFSPDGRYIVLGCPYDFDFRVWERVMV